MANLHPSSPLTVLYVVDALGLGGKTKSLVELVTHLDPNRYRGAVCSFTKEDGVLAQRLKAAGVPLYCVPCEDGIRPGMIPRMFPIIRDVRPQVVHCYNPRPILYGGAAARLKGIRATVGSLSAFACQVPDRDYSFLPQRLNTLSRRNVYRNRLAGRLMRRVVTISKALGERFFRYNGLSPEKLRVVSYGVDVQCPFLHTQDEITALRRRIGVEDGEVLIGSVGRLVEQKDYPTQLKAFALALQKVPNLRMVLAGEGPLLEDLQRLACELNVQDRVVFFGLCEQVPLLMRALDIFVLASKFEPYGVVLLEAKAAGTALVSTRVNEIPEIITDGVTGLLSAAEDPADMAGQMVRLAMDGDLRRRLGSAARVEGTERHSLDTMVRQYQDIYDDVRRP